MKIRSSFVSNSSSASFVLASNGKREIKVSVMVNLETLGECIETIEQYEKHVSGSRWYEDFEDYLRQNGDWAREQHEEVKKALENGKVVYVGRIGNDWGEPVITMLYEQGFPESDEYEMIQNVR